MIAAGGYLNSSLGYVLAVNIRKINLSLGILALNLLI
jgi:hypothetical protein